MAAWRNWIGLWTGVGLTMLSAEARAAPPPTASQAPAGQAPDAKQFDDQFRPLLVRHCVACHSGAKPKGNLRLDNLGLDLADAANREHWEAVIERLKAGEMPPKEKPRPPEKVIQALTDWLAPRVTAADTDARAE